jgi:uncharacterized protein (DUF1778 family)
MKAATTKTSSDGSAAKRSRLEARVSQSLKQKLERAAAIKGLTLSSFVVRSMEQVAADVIHQHEHRELSESAQHAFFEALMNPPAK